MIPAIRREMDRIDCCVGYFRNCHGASLVMYRPLINNMMNEWPNEIFAFWLSLKGTMVIACLMWQTPTQGGDIPGLDR